MGKVRLPMLFAARYLRSRGAMSVVNIVSRVSSVAVGIPVAAMIILLSVFNGFGSLVEYTYDLSSPDLTVRPAEGKTFSAAALDTAAVARTEGVGAVSYVLEGDVLIEYRGRQLIGTLRGVDSLYERVIPIRGLVKAGKYELRFGDMEQAVAGQGVAYRLGIRTQLYEPLKLYVPKRSEFSPLLPAANYRTGRLFPVGVYALDAKSDGRYVLSTLGFARGLLDYPGRASYAAVGLVPGAKPEAVAKRLRGLLGDGFRVSTRAEENSAVYRIMRYEKWAVFFVALLVLAVASFSVAGTVAMLITGKREDMLTLRALGADTALLRRIFVREGMLVSMLGAAGGIVLGAAFCWVQQRFGLIKIGAQTFLVDAYPVRMQWADIAGTAAASAAVAWSITMATVRGMIRPATEMK